MGVRCPPPTHLSQMTPKWTDYSTEQTFPKEKQMEGGYGKIQLWSFDCIFKKTVWKWLENDDHVTDKYWCIE